MSVTLGLQKLSISDQKEYEMMLYNPKAKPLAEDELMKSVNVGTSNTKELCRLLEVCQKTESVRLGEKLLIDFLVAFTAKSIFKTFLRDKTDIFPKYEQFITTLPVALTDQFYQSEAQTFLNYCTKVTTVELSPHVFSDKDLELPPSTKKVSLTTFGFLKPEKLATLIKKCSGLEELVTKCAIETDLIGVELPPSMKKVSIKMWSTVKGSTIALLLEKCTKIEEVELEAMKTDAKGLQFASTLKKLGLPSSLTNLDLNHIFKHSPNIEELDLSNSTCDLKDVQLTSTLIKLVLQGNLGTETDTLAKAVLNCPKLKEIDIRKTRIDIDELLKTAPQLKEKVKTGTLVIKH